MKFITVKKRSLIYAAIAFALFIGSVIGLTVTDSAKVFNNESPRSRPIYSVDRQENVVALTFDASFSAENTQGILDALNAHDANATFFVTGVWASRHTEQMQALNDSGRVEIGTHSNTHPHLSRQSARQVELELSTSVSVINDITGKEVELFRAPFGEYSDTILNTAQNLNLIPIHYDIDSQDWQDTASYDITNRVLQNTQNGSIVLLHNDGRNTLDALNGIIVGLKNRGFKFMTVGEMILRENYTINSNGRQVSTIIN